MTQKRVLIISYPYDIHARAVADAIRAKGHVCEEFFCSDYPTQITISLKSFNRSYSRHGDNKIEISEKAFDTVWLRRQRPAWLPETMHAGDREIALRQSNSCLNELIAAFDGPEVYWVNHIDREYTADLKMNQLRLAVKAGLSIPETLVSNEPAEIREFINCCGGVAIHKLLRGGAWRSMDGDHMYTCSTAKVTTDDLPTDKTLQLSPAIFQPLVSKQFEVRVACFGNYLVALSIDSQSDERASLDWRVGQRYVEMKPLTLPDDVAANIRKYMQLTGLAYAALDFIVTPDNQYVFLEGNPQGQFLWMESRAGIPVLDNFSEYLIAGQMNFSPGSSNIKTTWLQFKQKWDNGLKKSVEEHVLVPEIVCAPDYEY